MAAARKKGGGGSVAAFAHGGRLGIKLGQSRIGRGHALGIAGGFGAHLVFEGVDLAHFDQLGVRRGQERAPAIPKGSPARHARARPFSISPKRPYCMKK